MKKKNKLIKEKEKINTRTIQNVFFVSTKCF